MRPERGQIAAILTMATITNLSYHNENLQPVGEAS